MKVITIESSAYQAMMEQIAEIAGYIRELKEEKQRQDAATKDCLLNTAQAAELLNVSTRTLQRMRDDHRIEYVIVRGTCPVSYTHLIPLCPHLYKKASKT